jgi:predicted flap endonuclease-1-like 5' DNA nuclease
VPAPDDLQRIEGIGPKISGLLQAAGITTFAQLAAGDVGRLERIVREAGITIADPTTWPEQARLAAAGRWDELEVLQEELKGGRRV